MPQLLRHCCSRISIEVALQDMSRTAFAGIKFQHTARARSPNASSPVLPASFLTRHTRSMGPLQFLLRLFNWRRREDDAEGFSLLNARSASGLYDVARDGGSTAQQSRPDSSQSLSTSQLSRHQQLSEIDHSVRRVDHDTAQIQPRGTLRFSECLFY